MARPCIGITTAHNAEQDYYYCRRNYTGGVRQAGGVPLLLPPLEDQDSILSCASRLDGLLLSGGGDLHPSLFGEQPHWKLGEFDPERDDFEFGLLRLMIDRGKPVLGICRGIQVINVALGGTIYQDLESQQPRSLQHRQETNRRYPTHFVTVREGSRLAASLGVPVSHQIGPDGHTADAHPADGQSGYRLQVNSLHHQAVRDAAPGLQVTAWADDGVIEGLEAPGSWVLGVQWHPEGLWAHDQAAASLFRALVIAAGG
jgi:putative glutamine amidotransferase